MTGDEILHSETHKVCNSTRSKEELPEKSKESIITLIYTKGEKNDCSNYRGISLLSTSYKIVSNSILSKLSP
jgi:hypothetical protein